MRTLLALIAAAAMIGGALYVRGGGAGPAGGGPLGSPEPAELVCVVDLRAVCDALSDADADVDVRVEEAGATAETLLKGATPEADAWLTLAPWPEIVSDARRRAGGSPLPEPDPALGRSPLVLVVAQERAAVLEQDCEDLSWRCIGASAGKSWSDLGGPETWGRLKPGFADPTENATGLLVLGQAASDFLGGSDFSARDLDNDRFYAWLGQLGDGLGGQASAGNTPLQQRLQFGAASFDVVGTTEAEAAPLLATSPRAAGLAMHYPKNLVVAEVVLAPLTDGDGTDRLRELVEGPGKTALAEAGWRVEGQPAAEGVPAQPALPEQPNTPSGGVLDALRARWEEISR